MQHEMHIDVDTTIYMLSSDYFILFYYILRTKYIVILFQLVVMLLILVLQFHRIPSPSWRT